MHLSLADIMDMESMYRRNLMNTLPGPRGVHLLGTKGHNGVENLGVFSSVVHIGANPPMLGFIMRPLTVPRQTYHHIQRVAFSRSTPSKMIFLNLPIKHQQNIKWKNLSLKQPA